MSGKYFVRPTDEQRIEFWERLFGSDRLPVKRPTTRPGNDGQPVYDLDIAAMLPAGVSRLAAHVRTKTGEDYLTVVGRIRQEGAAVPAVGLELLRDDERQRRPDFSNAAYQATLASW